jgi:RNA polymerase sigma-70 factor (ECF subfamily)
MSDAEQFEAFVRAYQDMVFSTAMRLLGSEKDAEDIAQEVFLKAYERFGELSKSQTAGGWLKTVARNLSINHLSRYRARWRFFSEMATTDDGEQREVDWAAPETHDADLAASDRRRLLEDALRRLPESQRVPLVLFHFEGLPYEEIAARLRLSLAKVKTDIHRGRDALRRRLKLTPEGAELEGLYGAESPCPS